MLRKAQDSTGIFLKQYTYRIVDKELYVYKNKKSMMHKSMYSLTGVFIQDEPDEMFDGTSI